ncbi:Hypothetical predicted protein [Mytilus galloprovincialis]|uniref:Conodipine-M alpha chain n=1 Tax=Mytilus galloprovincialis TaxID=29158 RepID=A0A8B6D646_MYTGA|nr:Hypothetical predicted protein [Mytilus galloprovincialis]
MFSRISLITLLCLSPWFARGDKCQTNQYINGCSIPLGIHLFFQDTFTPSCNRHDICYFCADHYGKTKEDCDSTFHTNMKSACNNVNKRFLLPAHYRCTAAAYTYFEAVSGFAGFAFEKPSPAWCAESWTKSCLFLS